MEETELQKKMRESMLKEIISKKMLNHVDEKFVERIVNRHIDKLMQPIDISKKVIEEALLELKEDPEIVETANKHQLTAHITNPELATYSSDRDRIKTRVNELLVRLSKADKIQRDILDYGGARKITIYRKKPQHEAK